MATIDLGKIKQVWRGTYSSSNTYAVDDLVAYTDSGITSTYIAIAASSNSNQQVPSTSGTATANYWEYVAKGSVSGGFTSHQVLPEAQPSLQDSHPHVGMYP